MCAESEDEDIPVLSADMKRGCGDKRHGLVTAKEGTAVESSMLSHTAAWT